MSLSECFDRLIDEIRDDVASKEKCDDTETAGGGGGGGGGVPPSNSDEQYVIYPETRESNAYSKRIDYLKSLKQN